MKDKLLEMIMRVIRVVFAKEIDCGIFNHKIMLLIPFILLRIYLI